MKPSIQKLQKFFRLEADRKYDNHAVIGGLERILDGWVAEARLDGLPEELINLVITRLRDYGRLTEKSRAESLQGLWKRIQRGEDDIPADEREDFSRPATGAAAKASPVPPPASPGPGISHSSSATPLPGAGQSASAPFPGPTPPTDPGAAISPPSSEVDQVEEAGPALASPAARPPEVQPAPFAPPSINLQPAVEPEALNAPLTVIQGVGRSYAEALSRLGLHTLRDLLYYFPFRYDDYSKMIPMNRLTYGEEVTVIGTVQTINTRPIHSGKHKITEAAVTDGAGTLRVTWFNQAYIAQRLQPGAHISLSGKVKQYLGRPVMDNPAWEYLEEEHLHTGRITPVYSLSEGIKLKWLRRLVKTVVTYWAPRVPDPLPPELRRSAGLTGLQAALMQVHLPDSWEALKAAQERLAFDEIFLLQLGVQAQKRAWQERTARAFAPDADWLAGQIARLPYRLTGAQRRVIDDLQHDLSTGRPMNRLIQGDVGSGKTVVAALVIARVVRDGAQAALMAPTSILAEQHYKSLLSLLSGTPTRPQAEPATAPPVEAELEPDAEMEPDAEPVEAETAEPQPPADAADTETGAQVYAELEPDEPIPSAEPETPPAPPALQAEQIRLMIGATPESEKEEIRRGLADGSIKLVIGTHALIEDPVVFQELELVIVDEQHRFGVEQRAALRAKGSNPHLLVMTATPIPRSLALTIYGDLDVSVIDEMPPGRLPVGTYVLMPRERERAYTLIRSQVEQGRQAFIIYPLIEGNDDSQTRAAVDEHVRLQKEVFPKLSMGLLHGRMRPDEKDAVMTDFRSGRYHVLVSTTVIEVGVDVPNATVMLIEGANRFGLAQLHQLRGRVGRNAEKSFCLLIPDSPDQTENERLQVMAATTDGFVLAEKDLEQRGPGQFLGTRQAGYAELQFANLTDIRLIEKARRFAQALFEQDPELSRPEHRLLAFALQQSWGGGKGDIS